MTDGAGGAIEAAIEAVEAASSAAVEAESGNVAEEFGDPSEEQVIEEMDNVAEEIYPETTPDNDEKKTELPTEVIEAMIKTRSGRDVKTPARFNN